MRTGVRIICAPWREIEYDVGIRSTGTRRADRMGDEMGRSTGLDRPRMEPSDFLSRLYELLGTTATAVAGPGKGREIS